MSHASAVLPLFSDADLLFLRDAVRRGGRVLAAVMQTVGFAAVMWLLLAGPGLLTDRASTVPARVVVASR